MVQTLLNIFSISNYATNSSIVIEHDQRNNSHGNITFVLKICSQILPLVTPSSARNLHFLQTLSCTYSPYLFVCAYSVLLSIILIFLWYSYMYFSLYECIIILIYSMTRQGIVDKICAHKLDKIQRKKNLKNQVIVGKK